MEFFQSTLSLILTIGILVTVHEFGHFWVARRCGVKVLRFSVGFGHPLAGFKDKHGTEFVIAAVPLGGYVKMLDERESDVAESERHMAFNQKTVKQRIAIASAGPLANFLFAIFAYWLMFASGYNVKIPVIGDVVDNTPAASAQLKTGQEITQVDSHPVSGWSEVEMQLLDRIGETGSIQVTVRDTFSGAETQHYLPVTEWFLGEQPDGMLRSLGIRPKLPNIPPKIDRVVDGSAAQASGIQKDDLILSVDGKAIQDWLELVQFIQDSEGKTLTLGVERQGEGIQVNVRPVAVVQDDDRERYMLGVSPRPFEWPAEYIRHVQLDFVPALLRAVQQTGADISMQLGTIKKMIVGWISLENLSGPITIARVASDRISSGVEEFLRLLALISISLGILNLLPVPMLDGGHILYYAIEGLRGRPLPEKWQLIGLKIGLGLIVALMSIAFYNDFMRL